MDEQEKRRQFDLITEYYQKNGDYGQEALIAFLRETQELFGYVPQWAQESIAQAMQTKPTYISAVIKRYPSIKGEDGVCELILCTGPNCSKNGSAELVKEAQRMLREYPKLRKKVRLRTTGCLRQCRSSPNGKLDGVLHSGLTVQTLRKLLQKLANE